MRLEVVGYTKRSFSLVQITHGDEADLVFGASGYKSTKPSALVLDKDTNTYKVSLFNEINEFIKKYLNKEKQFELYECYRRLEQIIEQFGGSGEMTKVAGGPIMKQLSDVVKSIYKIVDIKDCRDYVTTSTSITLPPGLSDEYITEDKITRDYKDKTYRKSEYIDLVAYALALRLMIPIWGFYLPIAAEQYGIDMKEYYSYKLLDGSAIIKSPTIARLESYLRANLKEDDFEFAVMFKFLTPEEVPIYLMALAMIRKLSVAPLSFNVDSDHLMKIIYNYATGNGDRLPGAFLGNVSRKERDDATSAENASVWCSYKQKAQLSAGDISTYQVYVEKYVKCAHAIDPEVPADKIAMCVEHALQIQDFDPRDEQKGFLIWIMSAVIPGIAIELLDRVPHLTAMGLCQAILWHWNLKPLAVLLTAAAVKMDDDEMMAPEPNIPLSKESLASLDFINPYTLPDNRRDGSMPLNSAVRDIEEMSEELFKTNWVARCPRDLLRECFGAHADKMTEFETPADTRNHLAEVLIRMNARAH